MPLGPGTRVGPYEIVSAIGAGGMGEVYRARDTKLGRDVALKVIPDTFALDADRVARFKREAQVLASLNHPHIAAIYGFEDSGETHALVLELVEGETLADRIARGPIPVDEALPIAKQIAEALEAAHEQGIIHRDLKPANIKVTPDGAVKVLDFGLAKLNDPDASNAPNGPNALSMSPTITSPAMMTGVGMLLGTAAYMAPEQAKGRPADKRSDIWAFGCVLYEMLTGKRAFDGEDMTDVIAAIVRGEPEWAALPSDLPASIRTIVRQCLEKDRRRRIADIAVVQYLLHEPAQVAAGAPAVGATPARGGRVWLMVAAGIVLGAAAAMFGSRLMTRPAPVHVSRFEIVPPDAAPLASPAGVNVAISRDGSTLVYHAQPGGVQQLLMRRIGELEAKPIPGTELASNPFFSPDGSRIGFVIGNQLKTISLAGGPPSVVCDVPGLVAGASWAGDVIVFAQAGSGLFRVPATGGRAENVAKPDASKGEIDYLWPQILPDGKAVLYTVFGTGGARQARVAVRHLDSADPRILVEGGNGAGYISSGHLLYAVIPDSVMAVPFDITRLEVRGSAVPVLSGVIVKANGAMNVVVADDGTLVYVKGSGTVFQGALGFQWVGRDGKPAGVVATQIEGPRYPHLSPDARSLAVTIGPANQGNIWVIDLTGASQARELTFRAHNVEPTWSPDGTYLVFTSDRDGQRNLFRIAADGSAQEPTRLTTSANAQEPEAWSPDGQWLLYREVSPKTRTDLLLLGPDGKSRPWLQTEFDEEAASFSPDGRWVSYVSDQTGRAEIWVRPFPGPGAPIRVSADGGREPVWSRNGSELFYQSGRKLMTAEVATHQPALQFKPPRVLFEGGFVPFDANVPKTYDVAPDGRFLMIKEDQRPAPASLVVVQHFDEELKRLVPTK
jgi:serine/threonine-protein kinase